MPTVDRSLDAFIERAYDQLPAEVDGLAAFDQASREQSLLHQIRELEQRADRADTRVRSFEIAAAAEEARRRASSRLGRWGGLAAAFVLGGAVAWVIHLVTPREVIVQAALPPSTTERIGSSPTMTPAVTPAVTPATPTAAIDTRPPDVVAAPPRPTIDSSSPTAPATPPPATVPPRRPVPTSRPATAATAPVQAAPRGATATEGTPVTKPADAATSSPPPADSKNEALYNPF